ncbi:cysteine-rich secretory protein 3-like isoform X2 [Hyla sarda]|uniref:cysteine-rich secretory protein 3-like isoform X2 n=1 Tax=Hyla sarda TaxID=327740 RepID=UPI0024C3E814|nr:cysteine-rich secretory protein 3-like isoform X2 [Hyla sarda]
MWLSALRLSTLLVFNVVLSQVTDSLDDLSIHNPVLQKKFFNQFSQYGKSVLSTSGNMTEMSWNNEAANNAEKWAKQCKFSHSEKEDRVIGDVENWDDWEELETTEHFSQKLWASITMVGCAMSSCPNEKRQNYMLVCHFCPV